MDLKVCPERQKKFADSGTGIFIRAKNAEGEWFSADIAWLDKESFETWIRSRHTLAEQVLMVLMGYPRD